MSNQTVSSKPEFQAFRKAIRLIAAPFTPYKKNGAVHFEAIENYAKNLSDSGVSGVFIGGTTGEGLSLTREERIRLAEVWRSASRSRLSLIVHVGHSSIEESKVLAAHAESIGAEGIASIGPIFFEPSSSRCWVAACQEMAAAAPSTPFYYYHMPSMSRIRAVASSLMPEMAELIPTFKGIKFTHEDLEDYAKCLELGGNRLEIFFGRDELLLDGLNRGAISAVGSTYNFAAPLYLKIARLHSEGRQSEAADCQSLCTQAIQTMIRNGGLPAIRTVLKLCGIDCGPMRLPLMALDKAQEQRLAEELTALGYFDQLRDARAEVCP